MTLRRCGPGTWSWKMPCCSGRKSWGILWNSHPKDIFVWCNLILFEWCFWKLLLEGTTILKGEARIENRDPKSVVPSWGRDKGNPDDGRPELRNNQFTLVEGVPIASHFLGVCVTPLIDQHINPGLTLHGRVTLRYGKYIGTIIYWNYFCCIWTLGMRYAQTKSIWMRQWWVQ